MSALGHKRTRAPQYVVSALLPIADMCGALGHVCYGPITDMRRSLDHLVGAGKEGR
jgi:5,10-methenyltetrahydromethanopterin hydrogenase